MATNEPPTQAAISLSFPYTAAPEEPDWHYIILDPISSLNIPRMYFHEGSLYAFSTAGTAQDAVIRDYEGLRDPPKGWLITGTNAKTPEFWKRFTEACMHPQVALDVAARQAIESMKDL